MTKRQEHRIFIVGLIVITIVFGGGALLAFVYNIPYRWLGLYGVLCGLLITSVAAVRLHNKPHWATQKGKPPSPAWIIGLAIPQWTIYMLAGPVSYYERGSLLLSSLFAGVAMGFGVVLLWRRHGQRRTASTTP